jgi:uncharacterized protein YdeI (YjbR/CyaY-like superfamily)
MGTRTKAFDTYIKSKPDWAQPILNTIRDTVHDACPDVEEEMKWSSPTFMYNGIMCGMVAFKNHCAFHFWKGELFMGRKMGGELGAAAQLGKLTSVKDLPPKKVIKDYVKQAMALNEQGVSIKRPAKKATKKKAEMPDYFMAAIRKNKKALAAYEGFSPSHQWEYIEWITDAKGEDTRNRRVAQAVEWMAEGKPRNWKYMR